LVPSNVSDKNIKITRWREWGKGGVGVLKERDGICSIEEKELV
jgi:hypothetical protein